GVAADPDAYDAETLRTAGDLPGGGTLVSSAIEPAAVSPYIWSADKSEDGAITLNGFAPSEDVRQRIVDATVVGNPDATVTDNLRIAAGAPDNFDAITDFGIDQLPDLASGSISLTDDEYAINGTAETSESYEAALFRANNELPAGSSLSIAAISPPLAEGVYNWGAAKGADGSIRLTGLMPDLEAKQRIAARAAQVNPGATIDDQMRVAAGAPDGFVASAETSLGFLPQFEVGAVQIADTEMSVQGRAADGDSFDAANLVGTDLPEGINLETEISLPVASGPYQVVANKSADVVTLQGFAPSRDAKDKIVAAAEGLGVNVVDRIQLASGAPDGLDWGAAGAYAVSGLQNTSTGRATLAGNSVTVDADTANGNAYAAAIADWDRPLPAGLSIGTEAIRLPVASPFNWEATFTDRLSIDGVVPSEEVKAANVAEAQRLFGENVRVVDTQDLAGGAPRGFEAATSVGLNSISRMEQAYARVTDNRLEVVGTAFTPSARTDIERKVINGVPPGFTGVANISVRPAPLETGGLGELNAPTCQDELNGVLAGGQIQFETNEAVINEGSFGLLDRLAYTAQACPDANIEVSGHTDADGGEDFNKKLSERRAVAVVNYLIVAGVSSGRLSPVGFGEAQPIASNDTAEGKAQNRRIEFTVQQ
ncbi:MAG: OmpA family protein, partial [Pseudomonadota bacterium]